MTEIFIWCLGFLVILQLFQAVLDLLQSRALIRVLKKRDEIYEQDQLIQIEQWDNVILRLRDVVEKLNDLEEELSTIHTNLHCLQEDVFDVVIKSAVEKTKKERGPYGPRKKKQIEHKKTPSN